MGDVQVGRGGADRLQRGQVALRFDLHRDLEKVVATLVAGTLARA